MKLSDKQVVILGALHDGAYLLENGNHWRIVADGVVEVPGPSCESLAKDRLLKVAERRPDGKVWKITDKGVYAIKVNHHAN